MKIISDKRWICIFSVIAALAVVFRIFDTQIAKAFYMEGNIFGGFCENIAAALPFMMCSFSCATLMICRNTHTTRTKNKVLNVVYGVLSAVFALIAGYYPFRNLKSANILVIVFIAFALVALSFYANYTLFKSTYQKIIMTNAAKITIISTLIITAVCFGSILIFNRLGYAQLQKYLSSFYNPEDITDKVKNSIISFPGAAAAMPVIANCLVKAVPKLKFSGKLVFTLSAVWTGVVGFGLVTTGNIYASEAVFGMLAANAAIFAVSKVSEKRENRI